MKKIFYIVSICLLSAACSGKSHKAEKILDSKTAYKNESKIELPGKFYNYANPKIPAYFSVETEGFHGQLPALKSDNTPSDNPITDAGATLGRVLFYDKKLSKNFTVSCSSCHKAAHGFSDERTLSEGFMRGETRRHSMGLTNARFYKPGHFFWDQRATTLEDQVLAPIQDLVEMGMTRDLLVERVEAAPYYPALFKAAFGDEKVSTVTISKALAQFVRSLISTTSKYDLGRAQVENRRDPFPNFSTLENEGKRLFSSPIPMGGFGCFACHQGEAFVAEEATSNGLDVDISSDIGYGQITRDPKTEGHFKVPSLKNVALRAPYMHDGRFSTLEEVVEHYSSGIKSSPNLKPPLSIFGKERFLMNAEQKTAIVAFLKTLTDEKMVNDPKFSDPFVK